MGNNTMGNNPNRDSSGKSNERREGMGKDQDQTQRQAGQRSDQSSRQSPGQGNQSNQGSQVGKTSPSRDQH